MRVQHASYTHPDLNKKLALLFRLLDLLQVNINASGRHSIPIVFPHHTHCPGQAPLHPQPLKKTGTHQHISINHVTISIKLSRHLFKNMMILQIDTGSALKLSFAILILSFGLASPISIYSRIIYLFDDSSIPASFKSPAFCVEDFSRSWKVTRTAQ